MVEIGSEKVPHGACLTGVRGGSNAIWTMPIWTDHFSKRGFPKQNYSFQVCDGDWGDLLCGRGKWCSSSWPIVFTRPESDRSLALSFTANALEIWLIWHWWRCPIESCQGTNFSTAFSQISDRLEIWNRLITACSQLVNSILYLFRQLMTKHPTFRIRSACGNVFGKSLA